VFKEKYLDFLLTKEQHEMLGTKIPDTVFVSKPKADYHHHGCLAAERLLVEDYMVSHCFRMGGGSHAKIQGVTTTIWPEENGYCVDIGGNCHRHQKAKRSFMHTIKPTLDNFDVVRHSWREDTFNSCVCVAPNCPHLQGSEDPEAPLKPAFAALASYTYALSLLDCLEIAHATQTGILYMAVQHFDPLAVRGALYGAEAQWDVEYDGKTHMVAFTPNGGSSYYHPIPTWLYGSNYHCEGKRAISWAIATVIGYTTIYRIVASEPVPNVVVRKSSLTKALTDPVDYGSYHTGSEVETATVFAALQRRAIPVANIWSMGPLLFIGLNSEQNIVIPKGVIGNLARLISGNARDPPSLQVLVNVAKQQIKEFGLEEDEAGIAPLAAAAIAFTKNIELETKIYSAIVNDHADNIRMHTLAMKLKLPSMAATVVVARLALISIMALWILAAFDTYIFDVYHLTKAFVRAIPSHSQIVNVTGYAIRDLFARLPRFNPAAYVSVAPIGIDHLRFIVMAFPAVLQRDRRLKYIGLFTVLAYALTWHFTDPMHRATLVYTVVPFLEEVYRICFGSLPIVLLESSGWRLSNPFTFLPFFLHMLCGYIQFGGRHQSIIRFIFAVCTHAWYNLTVVILTCVVRDYDDPADAKWCGPIPLATSILFVVTLPFALLCLFIIAHKHTAPLVTRAINYFVPNQLVAIDRHAMHPSLKKLAMFVTIPLNALWTGLGIASATGKVILNSRTSRAEITGKQHPLSRVENKRADTAGAPCIALLGLGVANHFPTANTSNQSNEYLALVERASQYTPEGVVILASFARTIRDNFDRFFSRRKLLPSRRIQAHSFERFLASQAPKLRPTYVQANEELSIAGAFALTKIFRTKNFIKREVLNKSKNVGIVPSGRVGVEESAPRAISPKTPHFKVIVGPFMLAYQAFISSCWTLEAMLTLSCGFTYQDMGRWLMKVMILIPNATFFLGDFSRMDSSIGLNKTDIENAIFKELGSGYCTIHGMTVEQALAGNFATKGVTNNGIRYRVPPTRKSGDYQTTGANSTHTGLFATFFVSKSTGVSVKALFDSADTSTPLLLVLFLGDDQVWAVSPLLVFRMRLATPPNFVERRYKDGTSVTMDEMECPALFKQRSTITDFKSVRLQPKPSLDHLCMDEDIEMKECKGVAVQEICEEFYQAAGFNLKLKIVASPWLVDFCSCRPFPCRVDSKNPDDYRVVFGPKPFRAICKIGWCLDGPKDDDGQQEWRNGMAYCAASCWSHVPVLRCFVERMCELCDPIDNQYKPDDWFYKPRSKNVEILHEEKAAEAFLAVYGFSLVDVEDDIRSKLALCSWGDQIQSVYIDACEPLDC
jgi:hypothetical protein